MDFSFNIRADTTRDETGSASLVDRHRRLPTHVRGLAGRPHLEPTKPTIGAGTRSITALENSMHISTGEPFVARVCSSGILEL
jgi:hypothetical protein